MKKGGASRQAHDAESKLIDQAILDMATEEMPHPGESNVSGPNCPSALLNASPPYSMNGPNDASLASSTSASVLTGVELLYKFHLYIRMLERAHESCTLEKIALSNELALEKSKNQELASQAAFQKRRIDMLQATLSSKNPAALPSLQDVPVSSETSSAVTDLSGFKNALFDCLQKIKQLDIVDESCYEPPSMPASEEMASQSLMSNRGSSGASNSVQMASQGVTLKTRDSAPHLYAVGERPYISERSQGPLSADFNDDSIQSTPQVFKSGKSTESARYKPSELNVDVKPVSILPRLAESDDLEYSLRERNEPMLPSPVKKKADVSIIDEQASSQRLSSLSHPNKIDTTNRQQSRKALQSNAGSLPGAVKKVLKAQALGHSDDQRVPSLKPHIDQAETLAAPDLDVIDQPVHKKPTKMEHPRQAENMEHSKHSEKIKQAKEAEKIEDSKQTEKMDDQKQAVTGVGYGAMEMFREGPSFPSIVSNDLLETSIFHFKLGKEQASGNNIDEPSVKTKDPWEAQPQATSKASASKIAEKIHKRENSAKQLPQLRKSTEVVTERTDAPQGTAELEHAASRKARPFEEKIYGHLLGINKVERHGDVAVSVADDCLVKIWNLENEFEKETIGASATLRGHRTAVTSLNINKQESSKKLLKFVTKSRDEECIFWEIKEPLKMSFSVPYADQAKFLVKTCAAKDLPKHIKFE